MEDYTLYINTRDYQGGSWFVGVKGSIQEWKNTALCWCDMDGNDELYEYIEKQKADKDLLDFINEVWTMEIVKYDKNNEEHRQLEQERERY